MMGLGTNNESLHDIRTILLLGEFEQGRYPFFIYDRVEDGVHVVFFSTNNQLLEDVISWHSLS